MSDKVQAKVDEINSSPDQQCAIGMGDSYNLFGTTLFGQGVRQAIAQQTKPPTDEGAPSGSSTPGITKYPQPVSFEAIYGLKDISGHHASCIQAKKYCTVGLGFIGDGEAVNKAKTAEEAQEKVADLLSGTGTVSTKVDDALDHITHFGFMNELLDACEDFMDTGTGYLEVHRNDANVIDGITQIPAKDLWPCTYKATGKSAKLYYQYRMPGGTTKYWVPFGLANRKWILSAEGPFGENQLKNEDVSELIPFLQPSNRVKFYGYPDWLSAAVDIDLLKKAKQYKVDFYHNRGVIDKVLIVSGEAVEAKAWKKIEDAFKGTIGAGNNFNSIAMNFKKEGVTAQVLNVGAEGGTEEQFSKDNETLTQNIVSSHGVPPLLANILIPGKLGASNEFVSSLMAFQLLRINAYQNVFEKALGNTLGGEDGVKGLTKEDFKLRTITSQIDVKGLDTMGKMRSEAVAPKNKDRDLKDGVKK